MFSLFLEKHASGARAIIAAAFSAAGLPAAF
jgi:hypothetical protein